MSLDISLYAVRRTEVYDANITHNLGAMAREGGFYQALWRPDECGVKTAADLTPFLEKGIAAMKAEPERFKKHDTPNGWGTYEQFLPWLEKLLAACKENPDAEVEVWR